MKMETITKVVISEADIVSALESTLRKNNLKPKKPIHIVISSKCCGFGMGEHYEYYIGDTIIECVKIDNE